MTQRFRRGFAEQRAILHRKPPELAKSAARGDVGNCFRTRFRVRKPTPRERHANATVAFLKMSSATGESSWPKVDDFPRVAFDTP